MTDKLTDRVLDRLLLTARTRNARTERPVTEEQRRELYDLMKFGPTSGNCYRARFVWVRSAEVKSKLPALAARTNAAKILVAPVTVIVGYDLNFGEQLPKLFPARGKDMQAYYSDPVLAQTTAFRNSSRQGAYLIITARAFGIGPRSDVRIPQRGSGSGVFYQHSHQIQFHLLHRLRKERKTFPAQSRLTFEDAGRFA